MLAFGIEHFDSLQPIEIVVDANTSGRADHVLEHVQFNGE
jgi:hypothetical protein